MDCMAPIRQHKIAACLLFVLLCTTGCNKTVTIWGTWQQATVHELSQLNGTTVVDSTYYLNGSGEDFTFTTIGTYYSSSSNGKYNLKAGTLTLMDTAFHPSHDTVYTVLNLTDHLLVLQRLDTVYRNPVVTELRTWTCLPQ